MSHAGHTVPKQHLIILKWEDPDKASCVHACDRDTGSGEMPLMSCHLQGGKEVPCPQTCVPHPMNIWKKGVQAFFGGRRAG